LIGPEQQRAAESTKQRLHANALAKSTRLPRAGCLFGTPQEVDQYTLVLLLRGGNPPELDDASSERLQRQHLGHLAEMKRRGLMIASGPFRDQVDDAWRGLCIYRVGIEEARRLAQDDPAVRIGRLRVEALSWLTRRGALPTTVS
jgi:uncharacterized protein